MGRERFGWEPVLAQAGGTLTWHNADASARPAQPPEALRVGLRKEQRVCA